MTNKVSPPDIPPAPKSKKGLTLEELELVFGKFPELRKSMKGRYDEISIMLNAKVLVIQVGDKIMSDNILIHQITSDKKLKTVSKEKTYTDDNTEMIIETQEISDESK